MKESVFRTITREISHAFRNGEFTFTAFGKLFGIEHVNRDEYRVITSENRDAGIRFTSNHGNLRFYLA